MRISEADLVTRLEALLADWVFFHEVIEACSDQTYREILRAWSDVRERHALERDAQGRYRRS